VPCFVSHTVDAEYLGEAGPELEFLDVNLTKDSSLLLHAIHSPFLLYSGLKRKEGRKNEGRKPDKKKKKTRPVQEFHLGSIVISGQEDTG
jgi:hypothetical protein